LTFITDLDDLIRYRHGDVKKLREIRDTVRHDNFITTDDKNYVESLITTHLKNKSLDKILSNKLVKTEIKLQPKSTSSGTKSDPAFNFSPNKKIGVFGGVAAAIAIIVIAGFAVTNQTDTIDSVLSTTTNPLSVNLDQSTYQNADIISISGISSSNADPVELSIKDTDNVKIWHETVNLKQGKFSTLVIAGGGGWENDGVYTLIIQQGNLENEIEFKFVA
jgi:hypothetical protein|tara:strand:+ start:655 stop:1314 length:660 start_codon:yes stop_codon:yes gene_type:complete